MTGPNYAIICLLVIVPTFALYEGDRCTLESSGAAGKCVLLQKCEYAKDLLKGDGRPQHCGYKGFDPIVCCPLTSKPPPGQRSEQQCDKYNPKPLNPFQKFVFGGTKSLAKEFPHMAVLGYGDKSDIQWLCGASLISEDFVLTAAHCIASQEFGLVQWVRLGDLDINNTTDDARPQDFSVRDRFVHPLYKSHSHYHDIALLKLDRPAKFDVYVNPACLYTKRNTTKKVFSATGWGTTEFLGDRSSHLMKVNIAHVRYEDCRKSYANVGGKLKNGIIDDMQICAGDEKGNDTCPGDSGGPLQIRGQRTKIFYSIIGITSFGKACGIAHSVGVYTRVAHYTEWIEDIVWP